MAQPSFTTSFTPTYHQDPYPYISPSLPTLSQADKTILITGGSSGLGLSIAKTFCRASASNVILLSRSSTKLASASKTLTTSLSEVEPGKRTKTEIHTYTCDVSDHARVTESFRDIAEKAGKIDILFSCAANSLRSIPVSNVKTESLKETFDVIVLSAVNLLN